MVLHSLGAPADVIGGGTEGAGILGCASAAAAGQTVYPGEEVLFEPSEQLQHQEVFYSKFTFYKEQSKSVGPSGSRTPSMIQINGCFFFVFFNVSEDFTWISLSRLGQLVFSGRGQLLVRDGAPGFLLQLRVFIQHHVLEV